MPPTPAPKIALCHEWLARRAGSEKTFEVMAAVFPDADLYALTVDRCSRFEFGGRSVTTTFLDRVPTLRRRRDLELPLMPLAWRYASRRTYDVVVTSSHACAKGFWPARGALHLCYCYTPMRYVWLPSSDQRLGSGPVGRLGARWLRRWDLASLTWVDEWAAISRAVRDRIASFYSRPARVIHPPVDTDYFTPDQQGRKEADFVLAVSRMTPYKRLDLAIRACSRLDYPLVIAGSGPEEGRLRSLAGELRARVEFVRSPDDVHLRELYRAARVLVFPGEDDFGIVPVEAQACGTPVVAYGRGGVLDTVVPGVTGVLVEAQQEDVLAEGILAALEKAMDPGECRQQAERFSKDRFRQEFQAWVGQAASLQG